MPPPREDDMDASSSESDFSGFESPEEPSTRKTPTAAMYDKDSDEEELERLVLGDRFGFRENLFKAGGNWDGDLEMMGLGGDGDGGDDDDAAGLEGVDDTDLFTLDTAGVDAAGAAAKLASGLEKMAQGDEPAWHDSDDEKLAVSLASVSRLRKLRVTEADDVVNGAEYSRRLRKEFLRINPLPAWAKTAEGPPTKRRRRSSAGSDSSSMASGGDDDGDEEVEAQPLEAFLRNVSKLGGYGGDAAGQKKKKLRPEVLDIQRTRELPDQHKAAVGSLSFHPEYPVLLSASAASVLYLHHIAPEAHPTPNPRLTSVQAKQVDIRRAEFLLPRGDKIFFAGRRRYFQHWDLPSGLVQKTSQIQGYQKEHKTMERFKLSPCGRYMAIIGSGRKGGGIITILSTVTMQWIASARITGRHGIADFAWWRTGDGMTILGRDGQVSEYSVESRKFVGTWIDEGSVGAIVLALGGHGGPSQLGEDRWVAVGSNSGITNIYERAELLEPASKTASREQRDGNSVDLKQRPEPRRVFEQLVTPITLLQFSPDGQLFAFGSQHKQDALKMVHLPSCTIYKNWPTSSTPLGRITALAFGRQSDLLAIGNDSGKIRLWQIRN